jgi:hypothetical protein
MATRRRSTRRRCRKRIGPTRVNDPRKVTVPQPGKTYLRDDIATTCFAPAITQNSVLVLSLARKISHAHSVSRCKKCPCFPLQRGVSVNRRNDCVHVHQAGVFSLLLQRSADNEHGKR